MFVTLIRHHDVDLFSPRYGADAAAVGKLSAAASAAEACIQLVPKIQSLWRAVVLSAIILDAVSHGILAQARLEGASQDSINDVHFANLRITRKT